MNFDALPGQGALFPENSRLKVLSISWESLVSNSQDLRKFGTYRHQSDSKKSKRLEGQIFPQILFGQSATGLSDYSRQQLLYLPSVTKESTQGWMKWPGSSFNFLWEEIKKPATGMNARAIIRAPQNNSLSSVP